MALKGRGRRCIYSGSLGHGVPVSFVLCQLVSGGQLVSEGCGT